MQRGYLHKGPKGTTAQNFKGQRDSDKNINYDCFSNQKWAGGKTNAVLMQYDTTLLNT